MGLQQQPQRRTAPEGSGCLYRPSSLESGAGTLRKWLPLLRPLQLRNERLFHEARHCETGREEDHVTRLLNHGQLKRHPLLRGPRRLRPLRSAGPRSHHCAIGVRAYLLLRAIVQLAGLHFESDPVGHMQSHRSIGAGALGGSEVWLLWGFAVLAQPVCRFKDEPRPTCAVVHACSKVASRNGAAGYKLMRSSHATWTSTLNPPTTSIPRQTEKTTTRHRPFVA